MKHLKGPQCIFTKTYTGSEVSLKILSHEWNLVDFRRVCCFSRWTRGKNNAQSFSLQPMGRNRITCILQNVFFLVTVRKCLNTFKFYTISDERLESYMRKVTATMFDFMNMKPEKKKKHQMHYNNSSLPVEMQLLKAIK